MVAALLSAGGPSLRLISVRVAFSSASAEVGRPSLSKVWHLIGLVARVLRARLKGARILYYVPGGDSLVPIVRDVVLLLSCRWAFPATVFHFHAGGLEQQVNRLPKPLRHIAERAYARPDVAIELSSYSPRDGKAVRARRVEIVPNGAPDLGPLALLTARRGKDAQIRVLYLGTLRESKGLFVLLEAVAMLAQTDQAVCLDLVGDAASLAEGDQLQERLAQDHLSELVTVHGSQGGVAKNALLAGADIFVYPSHFEAENLSVALIEAMMVGLPIVATRWRAAEDLVHDNITGLLVPVKDPEALASAIRQLAQDPVKRQIMGERGRARYEKDFTLEAFNRQMVELLSSLPSNSGKRRLGARRLDM